MTDIYEFIGTEFDWFAIDSSDCVAMFATAGSGFIPQSVMQCFSGHDEISQAIDSPHWGSALVWDDFANQGLYVYNWQLNNGPYTRVRVPAVQADGKFMRKIEGLGALPKFTGYFLDVDTFDGLEGWCDII